MSGKSVFLGDFVHCKDLDNLETLESTAIFVDENGVIVSIEAGCDLKKAEEISIPRLGWEKRDVTVRVAKKGQFFFPGFIGMLILEDNSRVRR